MTEAVRSIDEAKAAVGDMLPGHLMNTRTGERRWSGLSPRDVVAGWLAGLRAAGIDAKVAKVFRNGGYVTLPLVIKIPCPREHVDSSRERFANVLLRVEPFSGWITIHEDSCSRCTQRQIEVWLLTCPRCASNDDDHPDHEVFADYQGDVSPVAQVIGAMYPLQFESEGGTTASNVRSATWTKAASVGWLDSLKTDDGSLLVPPTMGQAAAWDAVREVSGHPPQALVREAQAERKGRASSTD
jgi:hypothetical protein